MSPSQLRQGHSYTVSFGYASHGRYIVGSMRAEFTGKTNEGAYAFRLDRDRPYLALPAEFIRDIEPAERRQGLALRTNFGRTLEIDEIRDREASTGAASQMAEPLNETNA